MLRVLKKLTLTATAGFMLFWMVIGLADQYHLNNRTQPTSVQGVQSVR